MRVMFVAIGVEQLAISLLSAILRREGHAVGLAFSPHLFDDRYWQSLPWLSRLLEDENHVMDQIREFRPDVLCFSALTVNFRWALGVAARAKELFGVKTVFGGIHASAVPEIVLEEAAVDYVCVGEGDVALPRLLRNLAAGLEDRPIPNIAFRGPDGRVVRGPQADFIQNLDELPGFEKDLWVGRVPISEHYMTMSMRGCLYRCTFCFNNFFAELPGGRKGGAYLRQRSVDHFMRELVEAKRRYNIRYVHIKDDIFTINLAWMKEFGRRFAREIGVPFYCLSHPQHLDKEKIEVLKEAGCTTVQFGVESADEDYRKQELRRYENQDHVHRVMELLEKSGISRKVDHIFALPGEKMEAQEEAYRLYSRYDIERIGINWFVYLPGTEIVETSLQKGLITEADVAALNRGRMAAFLQSRAFVDKTLLKDYLAYEFLFKVLPLIPLSLRRWVKSRHVKRLPGGLLRVFGVIGDALTVLRLKDARYLLFYLDIYKIGLRNRLRRAFGRRGPDAQSAPESPAGAPAVQPQAVP